MKRHIISCMVLTGLIFSSCQSMELYPEDAISDAMFWKTEKDFKKATTNLYYSLESFPFSSGDNNSDISANYFALSSVSNGTYLPVETDATWDNAYYYIRNCNYILQKAEEAPVAVDVQKGEALFFRAYNYFNLLKRFGDVPLITRVLDVDSPELYEPRAPRTQIEDMIVADLEAAIPLLPLQSNLAAADIGRVTKGTAQSFLARVCLFTGTWAKYHSHRPVGDFLTKAQKNALDVIRSNEYSLFTGKGADSYRYLFIEEGDNSSEDILSNRYSTVIRTHNASSAAAWGWFGSPTRKFVDMYLCSDGLPIGKSSNFKGYDTPTAEFENRDPRLTLTVMTPGSKVLNSDFPEGVIYPLDFSNRPETKSGYRLIKYCGEIRMDETNKYGYDYHVIRYAEVLLIYAEATYEQTGSISDTDLDMSINEVRKRVNMPLLTNAFATSNGLDMQEEIRRERTIELAYEAFRYDDLRRWKTAEAEMKQDVKGVKFTGTEYEEKNPTYSGLLDANGFVIVESANDRHFINPKHYLAPLPLLQIMHNPSLEQNPGW